MPFAVTPNAAEFKGASWTNFIKTVPNSTPESARRVAMADPNITFFFYCREFMSLEGRGTFNRGDAVFFSGTPWPGSAPQADIYQKDRFTTGYVGTNGNKFSNVGCYTLQDGRQLFDIGCIFAANINLGSDGKSAVLWCNESVQATLDSGVVGQMQDLGITVLLSVLGNHQNAGWACFADQSAAQGFVDQLAAAVHKYGLDGIDIDDEYSSCTSQSTSLAMVTTLMKQTMPGKIVSKALFADTQYLTPEWKGHTLAGNLTYGWEMSYFDSDYAGRMQPYVAAGMQKNALAVGVSPEYGGGGAVASFVQQQGYGGAMLWDVTSSSADFLSTVSSVLYSENTVAKSNCLK